MRPVLHDLVLLLLLAHTNACGGAPPTPPPPPAAHGSIAFTWLITDPHNQPITCSHAGAATVAVMLRHRETGDTVNASFPCAGAPAIIDRVAVGPYDVVLTLLSADSATLARAPSASTTILADARTNAPPGMFALDPRGKLTLSLRPLTATANCTPPGIFGAGITGVTLALEHADGSCAPTTLVRTRGGVQVGSYEASCDRTPSVASCIETDETLTTLGLESGPFVVHVAGLVGATRCWAGDDVVTVPGAAKPLARTIQLTRQPGAGC